MPVLILLLVIVPLVELYVLIQVGQVIGALPTIGLLVLMSLLGAWLLRREGVRAWSRFRRTLDSGRLPTAEVVDGALVVLGGALMVTPGFVTDVVGLLLVLPPSRAALNRLLRARTSAFIGISAASPRRRGGGDVRRRRDRTRDRTNGTGDVVDVEVIDVQRTPRERAGDERRD